MTINRFFPTGRPGALLVAGVLLLTISAETGGRFVAPNGSVAGSVAGAVTAEGPAPAADAGRSADGRSDSGGGRGPGGRGGEVVALGAAAHGARACGTSSGARLCVSVPDVTLRGTVSVTTTVEGWSNQVRFSWGRTIRDAQPLLTAFGRPWALTWPTAAYPDGPGYLMAQAYSSGQGLGAPVALRLTIDNGGTRPAVARDWAARFAPRADPPADLWRADGPVIAAVGDGGDGTADSAAVAALIRRSPANVLLYLGDIYEKGTAAEWRTNFADNGWGPLVGFTQPVYGNHEAHNPDAWRAFWRGRPTWSTFTYAGVRFLLLDSECAKRGCPAQYAWARRVLAANRHSCVVAAWHRPVLSPGPEAPWMASLWRLVADHGGDLILNGHQHHMQAFRPLDGTLRRTGHVVQLISGAGGHIPHRDRDGDERSAWLATGVPGAVFITAGAGVLRWEFRDTRGRVVTTPAGPGTGSVTC
ncbi:metallophosphoesterase family protein [Luedemannella helvata]|uniref:Calcineurin-like phosphoesterase domain-containing protein n=1 Tax=Luedemannella helvata TaxID=349315 RepID=A0ABN2JRR4_9ACTN